MSSFFFGTPFPNFTVNNDRVLDNLRVRQPNTFKCPPATKDLINPNIPNPDKPDEQIGSNDPATNPTLRSGVAQAGALVYATEPIIATESPSGCFDGRNHIYFSDGDQWIPLANCLSEEDQCKPANPPKSVQYNKNGEFGGSGKFLFDEGNSPAKLTLQGRISMEQNLNDGQVAIGVEAGTNSQGQRAVAIGSSAGQTNQQVQAVAVGHWAGLAEQEGNAVAVGSRAGQTRQKEAAVAVGFRAGATDQGSNAVAVGNLAGTLTQKIGAVAVGFGAGQSNQGENAVAVGNRAGAYHQNNNTIVLNATGVALNTLPAGVGGRFFVKPIREMPDVGEFKTLVWNEASGEICWRDSD